MPTKQKSGFQKRPWLIALLVLVPIGMLLAASGFAFAATQESHDEFCGSCHSEPESTYLQRSTGIATVDLASYHSGEETRCIDCHSGRGIPGRVSAELMGARNAVKWFSGKAVQPAPLLVPIGDGNCLKCHESVVSRDYVARTNMTVPGNFRGEEEEAGTGHWHVFLSRWQAVDKNADRCVDCHPGHNMDGVAQYGFLDENNVARVCNDCHNSIGE